MVEIPALLFYVLVIACAFVSICIVLILVYLVLILREAKRLLEFLENESEALKQHIRNIGRVFKFLPLLLKRIL